VTAA
jgi:hypothetical protein